MLWLVLFALPQAAKGQNGPVLRAKADAGDVAAQQLLAQYYLFGAGGLPKNVDSSLHYLALAAAQGDAESQYLMGLYHVRGIHVKRNLATGLQWLDKAEAQNHLPALELLTELYGEPLGNQFLSTDQQIKPSDEKAFGYALKGAQLGNGDLAEYVAHAYHKGKGTPRNDSLAIVFMQQAAQKHKRPEAALTLGDWFYLGQTTYRIDLVRARTFYDLALKLPNLTPMQQARAEVGLHYVRQFPKMLYNARAAVNFLLPTNAFLVPFVH